MGGSFTEVEKDILVSSEKLKRLGWKERTLEETIADMVENFLESGHLKID